MACGIQLPSQRWNPGPCTGSAEFEPLDHQGNPNTWLFSYKNTSNNGLRAHSNSLWLNFNLNLTISVMTLGLPGWCSGKNLPASAGDTGNTGLIPGSGRSLGGANGNPFQYSCLEHLMDREAWWTRIPGVTQSQTRLSTYWPHFPKRSHFWGTGGYDLMYFLRERGKEEGGAGIIQP